MLPALLAKTALAASTLAHPAAAQAVPAHPPVVLSAAVHQHQAAEAKEITVQSGDTLSQLAAQHNVPGGWPSLFAANQAKISDPNMIQPGWTLKVPSQAMTATTTTAAYVPRHAAATSSGDPFDGHHGQCGDGDGDGMDMDCSLLHHHAAASTDSEAPASSSSTSSSSHYVARHSASTASSSSGSVAPSSSFEACVIARESGGNSQVMNSSGHYGLYQFSASTWAAYGGSPSAFGHASAAQQKAVFDNAIAQGGQSNWSPYDGC